MSFFLSVAGLPGGMGKAFRTSLTVKSLNPLRVRLSVKASGANNRRTLWSGFRCDLAVRANRSHAHGIEQLLGPVSHQQSWGPVS